MKKAKELHEVLRGIMDIGEQVFPALVKEVNKVDCTCTVEFDGLELGGIRLRATVNDGEKGIKVFPENGSVVLVQKLGEKEELFVTMYSEIEDFIVETGNTTVHANSEGLKVEKGTVSLRDIMDDLFGQVKAINNELQKVVVAIGVSPNLPALQGINQQLDNNRNKAKDLLQ